MHCFDAAKIRITTFTIRKSKLNNSYVKYQRIRYQNT